MNVGAVEYTDSDDNTCLLPNSLNQPFVNSRETLTSHIYDADIASLDAQERDHKRWGTMETAQGLSKMHSFDMATAHVLPYRITCKEPGKVVTPTAATCKATLSSIDAPIVGSPYACKLKGQQVFYALNLFGVDPKPLTEDSSALELFSVLLLHIDSTYNSLGSMEDYARLFVDLTTVISQAHEPLIGEPSRITPGGIIFSPTLADYIFISSTPFFSGMKIPTSNLELRNSVKALLHALTHIRIAFIDGLRRASGARQALIQRFPERSLTELALDYSKDSSILFAPAKPDYRELSKSVNVVLKVPTIGNKTSSSFSDAELALCRASSEYIQDCLSQIKARNFGDTLTQICNELQDSPAGLIIPGELIQRAHSAKDSLAKVPTLQKNQVQTKLLWTWCHKFLCTDTAECIQDLVKDCLHNISQSSDSPFTADSLCEKFLTNLEKRSTSTIFEHANFNNYDRPDLVSIVLFLGNYLFDKKSTKCLIQLVNTVSLGVFAQDLTQELKCVSADVQSDLGEPSYLSSKVRMWLSFLFNLSVM
jgi:hypothetical protein